MSKILFVCMGNICRSPSAEGVFRKLISEEAPDLQIKVDSAGTHAYHVGEPPDPRSQEAALRRGVDLSPLRARRVATRDFHEFDLLLAMDQTNLAALDNDCPSEVRHKMRLFLDYLDDPARREVPDPYYGGHAGFEQVLDLVEEASQALLNALRTREPSS